MKFKGTVALTATFILIVLYYFLIDVPTEERKREEKVRSERILAFDSENINAFSIIKGKETIALERSSIAEWQMTQPVDAKGDSEAVSTFLSFLANLSFARVVEESPKDLSVFGLDTPVMKVTLSTKKGDSKGIRIGDDHPMGNKVYLARLNESRVFTADVIKDHLDRRVYDLRDKTILDFEILKVKKLECIHNGKTFVFEKLQKSWELSDGKATAKGDENEIKNFLSIIRAAHIKEFLDEPPKKLTSYGLGNPKLIVKLFELGTDKSLSLSIGKKGDNGFYAKTLSGKNIFLIDQSLFKAINGCQLVDFMDKQLVDFKGEEVTNMTLRTSNEMIQLNRNIKDLQKWTIEKPINMQANTATVNSLLFDLKNARIVKFVKTSVTDLKPFGLYQPQKEMTLTYKDGKTWSLSLGNQTSNADHYFAQRTGEETVFILKNSDVDPIFRPLHELKDRTLVHFNNAEVQTIKIRNSEQSFILKKSANKWKLTQPKSIGSIQSFIGNDILWTLNSLEFESAFTIDPGNALTGLNQPLLSVELLNKKDVVLAYLAVGKGITKSPKLHYVKVGKDPRVYTTKKRIFKELPSNINSFKPKTPSD